MSAQRLFTLAPGSRFLDAIARELLRRTNAVADPISLSRAQVFAPNRRAARAFAEALHAAAGRPVLLPDIRALGDLDEEESGASFGVDSLSLPEALAPALRRGALIRLVSAWRKRRDEAPLPPATLLAAVDELSQLIDQSAMGGEVDWSMLPHLVEDQDLARHWSASASFLNIVGEAWPQQLAELRMLDPALRRLKAAHALAERWTREPPRDPVLVIGSTGAMPATRILMAATLRLSAGAVVLPGLDRELDDDAWKAVARAPSHPQYVLARTLRDLDATPADVADWPDEPRAPAAIARAKLINEALAPAVATRGWNARLTRLATPEEAPDFVRRGLAGVRLIEAADQSEQALTAALLLREVLETPGRTAALVTPDGDLARRTSATLRSWGIDVAPSAGTPFNRTLPGGLALILLGWIRDPADPTLLLALLKHPLTTPETSPETSPEPRRAAITWLEREWLRGPRRHSDLAALSASAEAKDQPAAAALLRGIEQALSTMSSLLSADEVEGPTLARELAALGEALVLHLGARPPESLWAGPAGRAAGQWFRDLSDITSGMGPLPPDQVLDLAEALAAEVVAAPDAAEHPRLAIWGPLEARLQRRDLMILGGLNEGSWPRLPAADPFLNRKLRQELGLNDPDERVGLAAHDFAELANAPEVVLLRARRVDEQPRVASRWIWRLSTLAAGGLKSRAEADRLLAPPPDKDPLRWARHLRRTPAVTPVSAPAPRPPADARELTYASPSRVSDLIRDPFTDYAKRILRLAPLERVGGPVDPGRRGTAAHAAIERHAQAMREGRALDLEDLFIDQLRRQGETISNLVYERPLWRRAATAYLDWTARRANRVRDYELEAKAQIVLETSYGVCRLSATADRIERLDDDTIAIIDFKTTPKSRSQVESGLEPQLPLEAAIANQTAFGGIGPATTSEIIYFQVSTSKGVDNPKNGEPLNVDVMALASEHTLALVDLLNQFADEATPYRSKPRAQYAADWGDYDRLARRQEWTADGHADE
ncbi:double-strand break repair protein AddB [bacterium]|nr:double-strand break repair protein AddB [bacterium]